MRGKIMATKKQNHQATGLDKKGTTPKQRTSWRTWAHMPGEDLVEMPRTLALDLIRLTDVSAFLHEASEEEAEAQLHETRWEAHKARMEKIAQGLCIHLCDEGLTPSADLMLRAMVMAYEAAQDIPRDREVTSD
jgi:hypothetical protein